MKEKSKFNNDCERYIDYLMDKLKEKYKNVSTNRMKTKVYLIFELPKEKKIYNFCNGIFFHYYYKKMALEYKMSDIEHFRLNNTIPKEIQNLL